MARYNDEFRASVVVMLRAAGYPDRKGALSEVARKVKVHAFTISRWFNRTSNPPPHKLVSVKKDDVIEFLKAEICAALQEMPEARPDAEYRELATAAAILIDKWQLLEGEPTERYDHTFTIEERANRIAALLDAARARRDGQSARPIDD